MSKKVNISIQASNLSLETQSAAQIIADMYNGWAGRNIARHFNQWVYNRIGGVSVIDVWLDCETSANFDNETGVHQITRISPLDPLHRRHTSFVSVSVDGAICGDSRVRRYTLDPYERIKDVRTGIERADAQNVLGGDIDMFLK